MCTRERVVSQAQQTAGQGAEGAQYGVQRAGSQLDRLMHERPLAVGAGALALGLAVGLAIPETRKEQEWMGDTRDSLVERAQQAVQDTAGKVSNVAGEAIDAAKAPRDSSGVDEGRLVQGGVKGGRPLTVAEVNQLADLDVRQRHQRMRRSRRALTFDNPPTSAATPLPSNTTPPNG